MSQENDDINTLNSVGMAPLHVAVNEGDMEGVKELLDKGADINFKDKKGYTALDCYIYRKYTLLHQAIYQGRADIAQILLEHQPDIIDVKDTKGCTALYRAVLAGKKDIVQILIQNGADPNVTDPQGCTALYRAVLAGKKDIVQILIQNGADLNVTDPQGCAALYHAVLEGQEDMVRLLVDKGANIYAQSNDGATAIDKAKLGTNPNILKLLLEASANSVPQSTEKPMDSRPEIPAGVKARARSLRDEANADLFVHKSGEQVLPSGPPHTHPRSF